LEKKRGKKSAAFEIEGKKEVSKNLRMRRGGTSDGMKRSQTMSASKRNIGGWTYNETVANTGSNKV